MYCFVFFDMCKRVTLNSHMKKLKKKTYFVSASIVHVKHVENSFNGVY